MSKTERLRAPGSGMGDLIVESPGPTSCGSVHDGIAVRFERHTSGFVLSVADLRRVLLWVDTHRSDP